MPYKPFESSCKPYKPSDLLSSSCTSFKSLIDNIHYDNKNLYDHLVWNSNPISSNSLTINNISNDTIKPNTIRVSDVFVKKIIFSNPATIVFWSDGSKTVVKCMDNEEFNPYYGFVCAFAKKLFGTNSAINRIIKEKSDSQTIKSEPIKKDNEPKETRIMDKPKRNRRLKRNAKKA